MALTGRNVKISNQVLFEDEIRTVVPFNQKETNLQLKRILNSPDSEDLLTWNVFRPLSDVRPSSRWLLLLFRKSLGDNFGVFSPGILEEKDLDGAELKFWHGRKTREYYPPREHNEWLKNKLERSEVPKYRERAKIGRRLEGPTEVDLVIETPKTLTFIEAKYQSDIGCQTTYDPYRDQIIRNLDVGTHQAETGNKKFFFILLTPECHERSRLYWYRMRECMKDPDRIKERLPYRPIDFEELSKSIGWVLWRDVIEIWKANKDGFQLRDTDQEKVPLVIKHFEQAGLV
jgi:hypothetical protein